MNSVSLDLSDSHDIFIRDGYTYKPFGSRVKPEYAVFVEGVDDMPLNMRVLWQ